MAETKSRTGKPLLIAVLMIVGMILAGTTPAAAKSDNTAPPLPDGLAEMVLGSPEAPVTIYEYASLTCHFCREFAVDRLPELKKKYIDSGQVKLVYRDFPLDGFALRASMISRCAGPDKYFDYADAYFEQQPEWVQGDLLEGLKKIARGQGMTDAEIDTCLADEDLSKLIVTAQQEGIAALGISSTPSFLIGGIVVSGALPVHTFEALIDTALINAGVIRR